MSNKTFLLVSICGNLECKTFLSSVVVCEILNRNGIQTYHNTSGYLVVCDNIDSEHSEVLKTSNAINRVMAPYHYTVNRCERFISSDSHFHKKDLENFFVINFDSLNSKLSNLNRLKEYILQ